MQARKRTCIHSSTLQTHAHFHFTASHNHHHHHNKTDISIEDRIIAQGIEEQSRIRIRGRPIHRTPRHKRRCAVERGLGRRQILVALDRSRPGDTSFPCGIVHRVGYIPEHHPSSDRRQLACACTARVLTRGHCCGLVPSPRQNNANRTSCTKMRYICRWIYAT